MPPSLLPMLLPLLILTSMPPSLVLVFCLPLSCFLSLAMLRYCSHEWQISQWMHDAL